MFTRREIVSHGAIGAIAASAVPASAEPAPQDDATKVANAIHALQSAVETPLRSAFQSNSLAQGSYIPQLRTAFSTFLRSSNKWPDYCEVGMSVFYDIYDWHVKHRLVPEVVRVLDNLIDNAVSFSPDGGLVRIIATVADDQVLVSVEDEGPGVPESEREHIFRRFHSVRPEGEAFGKH